MSNRFAIVLAALVIVFGGIFFFNKHKADAPSNGGSSSAAEATNHTEGSSSKNVTFVEYGDLQCPACYAYYPIVKETVDKYKDRVVFQFVNYPLSQLHPNAMAAHRAVEAASIQGKFWEMFDQIYSNHDSWASSTSASTIFEGYAQQLGLDAAKFKADAASSKVNDIINADIAKGNKLGITGTPTFFIDGKKIDSPPQDVAGFSKLLDSALAAKQ